MVKGNRHLFLPDDNNRRRHVCTYARAVCAHMKRIEESQTMFYYAYMLCNPHKFLLPIRKKLLRVRLKGY